MYLSDRGQRIGHIFAGIVERVAAFVAAEIVFVLPPLVELIRTLRAGIDLLKQDQVRIGGAEDVLDAGHILTHLLLGFRVDALAAVHEEVRVAAEPAVAGVEGQDAQRLPRHGLRGLIIAAGSSLGMSRAVFDDRQMTQHAAHDERNGQKHDHDPFGRFQRDPCPARHGLSLFFLFARFSRRLRRQLLRLHRRIDARRRAVELRPRGSGGSLLFLFKLFQFFHGARLLWFLFFIIACFCRVRKRNSQSRFIILCFDGSRRKMFHFLYCGHEIFVFCCRSCNFAKKMVK